MDQGVNTVNYGAITPTDAEVMDTVFHHYRNEVVRVLEIGVWKGETARGMRDACLKNECQIDYTGIDSGRFADPDPPFHGAKYIIENSEQAWKKLGGMFDVVFVDGCHCLNHVIMDAINYGRLVKVKGFILFHDTAPHLQHVQRNPWVHPDKDAPENLTAVRDALHKLDWPCDKWTLAYDAFDPKSDIGGMMAFQRAI